MKISCLPKHCKELNEVAYLLSLNKINACEIFALCRKFYASKSFLAI